MLSLPKTSFPGGPALHSTPEARDYEDVAGPGQGRRGDT